MCTNGGFAGSCLCLFGKLCLLMGRFLQKTVCTSGKVFAENCEYLWEGFCRNLCVPLGRFFRKTGCTSGKVFSENCVYLWEGYFGKLCVPLGRFLQKTVCTVGKVFAENRERKIMLTAGKKFGRKIWFL